MELNTPTNDNETQFSYWQGGNVRWWLECVYSCVGVWVGGGWGGGVGRDGGWDYTRACFLL